MGHDFRFPYLWNEQAPSLPYIKWHLSAAEEPLWLSKPNFSTILDVTWNFPYCLLSAMRREKREGVKMPDNLNSNEVLLLKMFHMFPLLKWTQFCKLFTCGKTETGQQPTKHLNLRRDGFQNASHCAPLLVGLRWAQLLGNQTKWSHNNIQQRRYHFALSYVHASFFFF